MSGIKPFGVNTALLEQGLNKAYDNPNGLYYDSKTKNMFIAGTHNTRDVMTDIKLGSYLASHFAPHNKPHSSLFTRNTDANKMISRTARYKEAEQFLYMHPDVKYVNGHSLGGQISQALQENHPYLVSVSLNSPVERPNNENQIVLGSEYDPLSGLMMQDGYRYRKSTTHGYRGSKDTFIYFRNKPN